MNDYIDEELKIASEQDGEKSKSLSTEVFNLPIKDLGLKKPLCVSENSKVLEVCSLMKKSNIGSVLVTDSDNKLCGIFTERDLLMKVIVDESEFNQRPISDYMTRSPISLREEDKIAYAMNNMHVGGYRHVPIIDSDNYPVGIISIKDVMSFILDYFPDEVLNLTGEPFRGPVSREGA